MLFFILITLEIVILYFFHKNYYKISKRLSIIDMANEKRKIHKEPVPLAGGLIFICISILIIIDTYQRNDHFLRIILFGSIPLGILGFLDDKYKIDSFIRLIISSFVIFFLISNYDWLVIKNIVIFDNFEIFFSEKISKVFTVICLICLINAFNMCDGINNLAIIIAFIWLTLISNFYSLISFSFALMIIPAIYFSIMNYKNKIFLGDCGTYFIASLVGFFTIYRYNVDDSIFYKDVLSILLLFLLPGLDMIRLVIVRLIKKKNPLKADRDHFHHLLLDKFGYLKTFTIIITLILFSNCLYILNIFETYVILVSAVIVYFFILFKLKYHL